MTETEKIQCQITKILMEKVYVEVPSASTDLMEAGLLDSIGLVELILGIEEQFGVQVPLEEIEIDHFRSVMRIAELVGQRKGLKPETPK